MAKKIQGIVMEHEEVQSADGRTFRIADNPEASGIPRIGCVVSFEVLEVYAINLSPILLPDERCETKNCLYKAISYDGFCEHCEIDRALMREDDERRLA